MPRKLRQLRADLRKAGWYIDHQTGSHQRWKHPLVRDYDVTLAGADGADAKAYQERDVQEAVRRALAAKKGELS
jgi:predicted RNA binding protein YcfA (HicA-like mRNA interferase family)